MQSSLTAVLVQSYASPEYRGRMQSLVQMADAFANVWTFLAGVMSDYIGVQWASAGIAGFIVLLSGFFLVFARRLVRLN